MHLIAGTNNQGYCQALMKAWGCSGGEFSTPVKSSLTKVRARIRYDFFEREFKKLLNGFEKYRHELRGFRIYAIDGEYLQLPCSKEILEKNYRGVCLSQAKETHYPHMYVTHAYDVLSGVTKDVRVGKNRQEIVDAIDMVASFEKNSVCLYDRYYLSKALIQAHKKAGNHFIARCRRSSFTEIRDFFKSDKNHISTLIEGVEVQLLKIKNPKTKEIIVHATSLPIGIFKKKEVSVLYTRRWNIETLFRDSTVTHFKLEQWHSKSINGILQELFTHYWLTNFCRIQIAMDTPFSEDTYLEKIYTRANFKWITEALVQAIPDLLKRNFKKVLKLIRFIILKSTEKRKHFGRQYKRYVKTSVKRYRRAMAVPRRATK